MKQYPIVGMRFRPPADYIVKHLPINSTLYLIADPFNEYDKNAIAVWAGMNEALDNPAFLKAMTSLRDTSWVGQNLVMLGFLPKEVAKHCREQGFPAQGEIVGKFYIPFGSNIPHVKFEDDYARQ